jgi:PhnB protein
MAITPYLLYEDVAGALKFLSKAFGFKKYGRAMPGTGGKVNHAAMKLGDDLIMMGYPGPKFKNPIARAKGAGAKILEEPQDTLYGHRRYGAEDPEGHQWYFAHEIKARASTKTH